MHHGSGNEPANFGSVWPCARSYCQDVTDLFESIALKVLGVTENLFSVTAMDDLAYAYPVLLHY